MVAASGAYSVGDPVPAVQPVVPSAVFVVTVAPSVCAVAANCAARPEP